MGKARFGLIVSFFVIFAGLATLSPARYALAEDGADDPPNDTLRIPGLPDIRMPPGAHVYGPGAHPPHHYGPGGEVYDPKVHGPSQDGMGTIERHGFGAGQMGQGRVSPDPLSPGPLRPDQMGQGQMPSTVIGPGGIVRPGPRGNAFARPPVQKPLTAEERAARIRKALAPKPPLSVVRRQTLDDLYRKLAAATDETEAKGLASLIGSIWMRSDSDTANFLMQRAMQAIGKKDYTVALDQLDRLIELKPAWAEAWNKRASVRFYMGNFDGSMADVEHVLKLEPKHFGALDGMAAILQHTGFDKRALEVYRRSLAIYPHQPEIEKTVDKLQLEVEGQGI